MAMWMFREIVPDRRRTISSSMPNANPNPDCDCCNHDERHDHSYQLFDRLEVISIGRRLCGLLDTAVDFRQRVSVEQLRRCARQSLSIWSELVFCQSMSTRLRRKTACIKLKRCRIIVSFWSSGSLIVPNKFQFGTIIVLDELHRGIAIYNFSQLLQGFRSVLFT